MADALIEIGINSPAQLRRVGAAQAFRRLRFAHGRKITLTWIYALDIAITGDSWDALTPARMAALRAEVENSVPPVRKG